MQVMPLMRAPASSDQGSIIPPPLPWPYEVEAAVRVLYATFVPHSPLADAQLQLARLAPPPSYFAQLVQAGGAGSAEPEVSHLGSSACGGLAAAGSGMAAAAPSDQPCCVGTAPLPAGRGTLEVITAYNSEGGGP